MNVAKFDAAEYLESREDLAAYLDAALDENDPQFFAKALGTVARSQGMTEIARRSGVGREGLYKALSGEGNPAFGTVLRALDAMGLSLKIQPKTTALV